MDEQDIPNNTAAGIPSSDRDPAEKEMPEQVSLDSSPDQNERLAHFIQMLTDDNEGNRWKAAEMLGRIGDPKAVEPLIETLWDDDSRVRLKAAWALGQIGDQRGIRPLQRLYRMEDEWAQEIIARALEEIKRRMSLE
ncbi:MAG: HEAT repeat domain-containing protein [Methanoregula sp.]|nr:HEAT repeat domain-containing protein [Methanoregula sp.]